MNNEQLYLRLIKKASIIGFFVIASTVLSWQSFYTIEEGHVGIVKRFNQAKNQVNPGLHFKAPFIDAIELMEIRTRKNEERMPSSTSEQMPVSVHVSVNWTVDKGAALDLYRKYGGLAQFEARILDPRFRSAAKAVIPRFKAEQLIQDRSSAINQIEETLLKEMAGFPVRVDNVLIENISLPSKYIESIETKQTEKNLADAENHKLERQRLKALQKVNTADAEAQGIIMIANAEASSIKLKGEAEAFAISAKSKALKNNPLIVKLTEAQRWDGSLPKTIMGDSATPIIDMR